MNNEIYNYIKEIINLKDLYNNFEDKLYSKMNIDEKTKYIFFNSFPLSQTQFEEYKKFKKEIVYKYGTNKI